METAASVSATARSASLSLPAAAQTPPRKEWRAVERNAGGEDLERSKVGQSDERTIYEQGRVMIGAMDYHSMQMGGGAGALDEGMVQQRLHALARQREALARQRDALTRQGEELQQMEIELKAQVIARSEIMELHNSFEARMKEQVDMALKLQEELSDREQKMHDLEMKFENQERELHAMRLDTEKAWAKEDLLREQNMEIANFRRESENIEAERAHHIKQIHELQDHIQEKERQLMELQEQHRIAQENILYKDEQLKEAQSWISRIQEMDAYTHSLQAELRDRTDHYNQLWLSCQRQFVEMERLHMQTIQQLQHELADARGKDGRYNDEQRISQTNSEDVSHLVQNNGTHHELDGASSPTESGGSLQSGNLDKVQSFVSSGNGMIQNGHMSSVPVAPHSLIGIPPYLPPGQMAALHPYILHQQGANSSVPSHVPHSPSVQFHSVPALSPFQNWPSQQVAEGQPQSVQFQLPPSQSEGNVPRLESNYGFGISVDGSVLHPEYLNSRVGQGLEPHPVVSSAEETQFLKSADRSFVTPSQGQQSLDVMPLQFHETLRLNPVNATTEMKERDNGVASSTDSEPEIQSVTNEQALSAPSSSPSETLVHEGQLSESPENNALNAVEADSFTIPEQSNSLLAEKLSSDAALLGERELLTWIIRTIPAGCKICISSTLPNRLGKMLAPLHWHDYKRKYGKLDEFVAGHPELFVIEGDYIHVREGAQGIIAATTAVAKVAAAAAASSPYSSSFSSVAVTPMAQANRLKKVSSIGAKVMPTSGYGPSRLPAMQSHANGVGHSISGSHANVKILSKSQDSQELNGVRRPGQPSVALNIHENGVSSDRCGLGNPQPKVAYGGARASVNFVSRQQGRATAEPSASRR